MSKSLGNVVDPLEVGVSVDMMHQLYHIWTGFLK